MYLWKWRFRNWFDPIVSTFTWPYGISIYHVYSQFPSRHQIYTQDRNVCPGSTQASKFWPTFSTQETDWFSWGWSKKNPKPANLKKLSFSKQPILKNVFCFIPMKISQSLLGNNLGRTFDEYLGFQPVLTQGKHFCSEYKCVLSIYWDWSLIPYTSQCGPWSELLFICSKDSSSART